MKTITIDEVKPQPDIQPKYIGLTDTDNEKYILSFEFETYHQGYIFRLAANHEYSHSGQHNTKRETCYKALCADSKIKIYYFDSKEELEQWLAS